MHDTMCRLFKGLTPLWGRQIPYTMMKFGESFLQFRRMTYGLIATRLI